MPIFINGKKQKPRQETTLEDFINKVEEIVISKNITIHKDSNLDKEIRVAFKTLDYERAVSEYEMNSGYWEN